jgi:hypothetical protein
MSSLLDYRGRFFASRDWFQVLVQTTDVEPVIFASDEGVLPCKRENGRLASLTNFYSIEYEPIGAFETVLDRVGSELELRYLKDETIEQRIRDCGFSTYRFHQYANWTCPIESDFASYFAARPSRLRNTIKRRSKALMRDFRVELCVSTEPRAEEFTEVYNASWKQPEPFPEFIPALMKAASRLGILRVGLAFLNGEPAAAQLWLVESGRAIIYKLAYKEKFKDTSVGAVLSHELFRYAIDVDHVSLIDYGVGDEPYKAEWMTERGEVFGLMCYDRSAAGRVKSILANGKRLAKRILRR